jgi:hypothetical protein
MFLKTNFPQLWFPIEGTIRQLSMLLAERQPISAIGHALEITRIKELVQEGFDNMDPFAKHFTSSLALKAPNAKALKILSQRIEALAKLESRFDAQTSANHTAFDLNSAWPNRNPEPADVSYMEILLERLDIALLKAQAKGATEIQEVIIAVKAVLAEFLSAYQQPESYSSEFYELTS